MQHVDVNTSLKFRKISKAAKLAVDETLQSFSNSDDDTPYGFHYEESSSQQHLRNVANKINSCYEFNLNEFGLFLAKVFPDLTAISSNTNPFIMGHIHYTDHFSTLSLRRNDHVVNTLPKFGHHVSSIKCYLTEYRRTILPFSPFVSNLRQVPNLKRLEMNLFWDCNPLAPTYSVLPWLPTIAYEFPPLPKLVLLKVNSVHGENDSTSSFVLEILKEYSQQLTAFTCSATLFTLPSLNLECLNTSFPNMKKFHLLATHLEISTALHKLSNVSWRLEKLRLEVIVSGLLDDLGDPADILSTINKFHQSLVHLELDYPLESTDNFESEAENGNSYREMSKLKILITNPSNLKLKLFRRFLQGSCLCLKEIHLPTNTGEFMIFREEGRWALENIRSVEKVVFWKKTYVRDELTNIKYTMHRRKEAKSSH
ncbi:unnamed protein product [Orchesella dallaii]